MDLTTTLESIQNGSDNSAYLATFLQVKGKAAGTDSLLKLYTDQLKSLQEDDDSDVNSDAGYNKQKAINELKKQIKRTRQQAIKEHESVINHPTLTEFLETQNKKRSKQVLQEITSPMSGSLQFASTPTTSTSSSSNSHSIDVSVI
jgi:hypothetical protein